MTMRVEQSSGFLYDLVRQVAAGKMMPATFQRSYSWNRDDVEALWTSIIKGWPTGSLLLWQRPNSINPADAGRNRLGPIEVEENNDWSSLILDGQNRLATLAWSMLPPNASRPDPELLGDIEAETWGEDAVLVCDPDNNRIVFVPAEDADTGNYMPVAGLMDIRLLLNEVTRMEAQGRWNGEEVPERILRWMDDVGNRVRSSRTSWTSLERATVEEAVEAFVHIARAGVPVSERDIRAALSWTENPEPEVSAPSSPGMR